LGTVLVLLLVAGADISPGPQAAQDEHDQILKQGKIQDGGGRGG